MVTFSQQSSSQPSSAPSSRGQGKKFVPLVVVAAIIVGLLAGGYYFWQNRGTQISSGEYQAVFLTSGQTYFGKIAKSTGSEVVLRDIYYLITRPPLQTQTPEATPGARPQYTLIKLGQELHGPMDEMRINREHILFVEGLKKDGKVVQAIEQFKAQQQEQPQE